MKPKFKPGDPITSLDELATQDFIYCHCKVYHKGWFQSWPLRATIFELQRGIRKAVRLTNREYYEGRDLRRLQFQQYGNYCDCCPRNSNSDLKIDAYDCWDIASCDEAFKNWLESKVK